MNKYDFDGRTAIVTGGAQGIGHAVAEELAKGGARVAIWDTDFDLASKTAQELGDGSLSVKVDIANWSSVKAAYGKTKDAFGRVDIVVNSAGIAGSNAPVADYPVEEFHQIVAVNLLGAFHVNKVVAADMRDAKLWADRQHCLGRRQGRQPECVGLFLVQSRCDRADQITGQGTGRLRHCRELRHARRGPHAHF